MIPIAGWVAPFGYPRIKACSRLPMAFRSVPRPSSPPGAKASTECPSRAHSNTPIARATSVTPCTGTSHTRPGINPKPMQATRSRSHLHTHLALLNETQTMPGQTDITPRPKSAPEPIQLPTNNDTPKGLSPPDTSISCLPRRRPIPHHSQPPPAHAPGQDPRNGDDRDRTDDPLLAKQVLSQLSYAPAEPHQTNRTRADGHGMGQGGLEPPTPRLSSVCSNQLSY